MKGITISDIEPSTGVLAFDLHDVLRAIGDDALRSSWTVEGVECIGGEAATVLHDLSDRGQTIEGERLLALAAQLTQFVDGELAGRLPGEEREWIKIRAVDSSAYDVLTDRDDVLRTLRTLFRAVQDIDA